VLPSRSPLANDEILPYNVCMDLTLRIRLLPDADQHADLLAVMERFNEAANLAAQLAFKAGVFSQPSVHKLAYREIRDRFGLTAQLAVRAIGKAVEVFKRDKSVCPVFKPHGAVTYDERILSFKGLDTVSLATLKGRARIPIVFGEYQGKRFDRMKGQVDMVYADGIFHLYATVKVPAEPPIEVKAFLGVDLGIANIATDSDGTIHSGKSVDDVRRKHNLQRKRLQRKGTKGAKKKLKRVGKKESRFRKHQNHCISKTIVETARRTGRGIALEDLTGIRQRVTARGGDARNRLSGWAFGQLYAFITYKATIAGVPIATIDPHNTSRTCAECGHVAKSNRKSQSEFECKACSHKDHADRNAARNIRALGLSKRPIELGRPNV
jgi:putative transposase